MEYDKQMLTSISTSKTNISTTIPGMQGHKITKENQRVAEASGFNEQYIALIKG